MHSRQGVLLHSGHFGPWQGDMTWYDVGLGACGAWSQDSELVCAVSHVIYDAAATTSNPNENPLCQSSLRLLYNGKSVDVRVVDRCVDCEETDIDVSPGAFQQLANLDQGRVPISWQWNEISSETVCTN